MATNSFVILLLSSALVSVTVGYSAYNPINEGCCFKKEDGSSEPYDYQNHMCCDGTLIKKPMNEEGIPSWNHFCCGKELYNYESQVCCGGKIVAAEPGMECCFDQIYNTFNQTCCMSWGAFDKNLTTITHRILETEKYSTKQCCGIELYDPSQNVCCDNEIQTKSEHLLNMYHIGCCAGQQYNYHTHACCQKWAIVNGSLTGSSQILHEIQGNRKICCGTELFDYTMEICCQQTIVPRPEEAEPYAWPSCCGKHPITNHISQMCNNGVLLEREHYTQNVCNGTLYNTETDMCCGTDIVTYTEEDNALGRNECCLPPPNPFDFMRWS